VRSLLIKGGPLPWVVALFVVSRFVFHLVGVRFDYTLLDYGWQYLDPPLLRNGPVSLITNLFYMHGQPPLFNLFLGTVEQLSFGHALPVFSGLYWLMGLGFTVTIALLMERLGVPSYLNIFLSAVFLLSPSSILYENCLFYTYPIATALAAAALFVHRFMERGRRRDIVIASWLLALPPLMWSLFHLSWMLVVLLPTAAILWRSRNPAKLRILAFAYAAPLLLVVLVYTKNALLFGSFSPSSWFGISLAKITYLLMPQQLRIELVSKGELSDVSAVTPWSSPPQYPTSYFSFPKTGIPALDAERKTVGPSDFYNVNFHNLGYVAISRKYQQDALYVITHYPEYYLQGVRGAYEQYLMPSTSWPVFDFGWSQPSRAAIAPLVDFYNLYLYGCRVSKPAATLPGTGQAIYYGVSYLLAVLVPLLSLYGLVRALAAFRQGDQTLAAILLFLCVNILFVSVFCNVIETGENERYRFCIDAFFLILLGRLLGDALAVLGSVFKRV
jgi:uncharacterized membrane protein YhaH (DUF805 family)